MSGVLESPLVDEIRARKTEGCPGKLKDVNRDGRMMCLFGSSEITARSILYSKTGREGGERGGDDPRIDDYALWFIRTVKTFCQEQPATQHIRGPEYASQYKLTAARR